MSLQSWFRPPRQLIALFVLITLVPSVLLFAVGWRLFQQGRAIGLQQLQERREQTADLVVSALEQSLEAAEQALRDPAALQTLAQAEDAVAITFTPGRVEAFPQGRLLDGGQRRKLDIDVDNWVIPGGGFRLHPDGRQIAFVSEAGKPGWEIWALENFLPR